MSIMTFMEIMGANNFPIIAAFFIGLMTAISPCPLATNITAIAYASKRLGNKKHIISTGLAYTLGRMFTYTALASAIVYIGLNIQTTSLFLQIYGDKLIGPVLIAIGIIMLDVFKFNFIKTNNRMDSLKEKLSVSGYIGSFLLGVTFALAFCPFSAVLFFGMLIPLALKFSDGILIPLTFAFATGLPVIIFSFILACSVSKLGVIMNKVQIFEKWMRKSVSVVFIMVGIYYITTVYLI